MKTIKLYRAKRTILTTDFSPINLGEIKKGYEQDGRIYVAMGNGYSCGFNLKDFEVVENNFVNECKELLESLFLDQENNASFSGSRGDISLLQNFYDKYFKADSK